MQRYIDNNSGITWIAAGWATALTKVDHYGITFRFTLTFRFILGQYSY